LTDFFDVKKKEGGRKKVIMEARSDTPLFGGEELQDDVDDGVGCCVLFCVEWTFRVCDGERGGGSPHCHRSGTVPIDCKVGGDPPPIRCGDGKTTKLRDLFHKANGVVYHGWIHHGSTNAIHQSMQGLSIDPALSS
jgi:hypothetical protein